MNAYLDSSALVKLAQAEPGSVQVGGILDEAPQAASSVIAYAEGRSALARSGRSGAALARARGEFDAVWADVDALPVDEATAVEAGALAERHRLRGMDALHLAAALRYAAGSVPDEVAFVSWDKDQRAAAEAEGLQVLPRKL